MLWAQFIRLGRDLINEESSDTQPVPRGIRYGKFHVLAAVYDHIEILGCDGVLFCTGVITFLRTLECPFSGSKSNLIL